MLNVSNFIRVNSEYGHLVTERNTEPFRGQFFFEEVEEEETKKI